MLQNVYRGVRLGSPPQIFLLCRHWRRKWEGIKAKMPRFLTDALKSLPVKEGNAEEQKTDFTRLKVALDYCLTLVPALTMASS